MRKTYYEQLKEIHSDLREITFDGFELTMVLSSEDMTKREFASNSETYRLVSEIEHLLLSI